MRSKYFLSCFIIYVNFGNLISQNRPHYISDALKISADSVKSLNYSLCDKKLKDSIEVFRVRLYQYKHIEKLELRCVQFIPPEIFQMLSVKTLIISDSYLKRINSDIVKMSGIESVCIINSRVKIIPSSLFALPKVRKIEVSGNKLRAITYPKRANTNSIEVILLHANCFTKFPTALFYFSKVEVLDLSTNEIRTIPSEINKMTNLVRLNLQGNRISTLPESMASLTSLKELDLRNNPLNLTQIKAIEAKMPFCKFYY